MAVVHEIKVVAGVRTFYGVGFPDGYLGTQLLDGDRFVDKISNVTYEFTGGKWGVYVANVAPAGKSAYEIWLGLGNSGTEADFIASLKGIPGEITTKTVTKNITVPGDNGASAYEIWLANGHVGTEADFLASLKGADGYTPVKGVDYNDGTPGYTPVKGVDYNDGTPGYTPVKGVDYNDGTPGYTPVKGVDYNDGNAGTNGKTILSGTAAPTTEGVDGDFYIRTSTNYIYGPKAGGVWPAGVSINGAAGTPGTNNYPPLLWNM